MFTIEKIHNKPKIYNNNRLIEYTPIIPSNPIIINYTWFYKQSNSIQKELYDNFSNLLIDEFVLPHDNFKENEVYWKFLYIYKQQYLFDVYEFLFDDCYIVKLSNDEINELLGLCIQYKNNKNISENIDNMISIELYDKINIQLNKCNFENKGIFVKTSIKSAKNHTKLIPCNTVKDILNNLIVSPQVIQSLLVENCSIVMRKWNYKINNNNEFRVFILDREIKCISQQKIDNIIIFYDVNIIIDSICTMWNALSERVSYNDCVIDCYIDNNTSYLIEINSGGCWSTAGSALFDWNEIINFTHPVFRILTNI